MPATGSIAGYSEDVLAASATQTATGQTGVLSGYGGASTLRVQVNVTAASGTTPTMTVAIQDTLDGTNWNTVGITSSLTTTGVTILEIGAGLANNHVFADRLRVQWTIGGTTPSFTFEVRACDQSPLT